MVDEALVGHGNLRVNQEELSLHHRYMRQLRREVLDLNQILYLKCFFQVALFYKHLRWLVELYELHGQLLREYK
jgi:hypothetical protein